MSKPLFSDNAWEDYLYWQSQDKKTLKRINALVKDIERNGNDNGVSHLFNVILAIWKQENTR